MRPLFGFSADWYFIFYCEGAIELSILADYYGHEIAAYDIQTTRCDLYGQVRISSELSFIQILSTFDYWVLFCCTLIGKEAFWKGYADLWWAALWCFSCMCFCLFNLVSIFSYCWLSIWFRKFCNCPYSICRSSYFFCHLLSPTWDIF